MPFILPAQLLLRNSKGVLVPFLFLVPTHRKCPHEKNVVMIRFESAIKRFTLSKKTPDDIEWLQKRLYAVQCMAHFFPKRRVGKAL